MNFVLRTRNFESKTRNFVSKTRNCLSGTRNCVSKMMNFAASVAVMLWRHGCDTQAETAQGVTGLELAMMAARDDPRSGNYGCGVYT